MMSRATLPFTAVAVDSSNCIFEALNLIPGAFFTPNNRDFAEMCVNRVNVLAALGELSCDTDDQTAVLTVRPDRRADGKTGPPC